MRYIFILCSLLISLAITASEPPLRQKIAKMLIVGFRGTEPSEAGAAKHDIEELGVGGVILFDIDVPAGRKFPRNITSPEQTSRLINYLKSLSDGKLMVAVDQEGGRVCRLKEKYGFPVSVTAEWLGQAGLDSTKRYAAITAEMVDKAGFNVNFVPCTDVNTNPDSPAIGRMKRSFSADPKVVAAHAREWIKVHRSKGVLTSVKHFPGHGSAKADSHYGMTDVTDTWQESELVPYAELIADSLVDMIMVSHVFNRRIDSLYPASLSAATINGLLRNKIGYNGVVISDDINMNAIVDHYSLERAFELAINAGVDILILGNNGTNGFIDNLAEKSINTIEKLVREGRITESRIDEAYSRIERMVQRSKK